MSAPSDGARADARKRLAESIGRLEGRGNWYADAELAGVIADAKAEERDDIERILQADLDAMEPISTSIATGLYRAVRFIQIRRNGAKS